MTFLEDSWEMTSDEQWALVKSTVAIGSEVEYIVCSHEPFGMLIKVLPSMVNGVIETILAGKAGFRNPEDLPAVGSIKKGKF